MFLALLILTAPPTVPDPPPLERRVADLERRVDLLESAARPATMPPPLAVVMPRTGVEVGR